MEGPRSRQGALFSSWASGGSKTNKAPALQGSAQIQEGSRAIGRWLLRCRKALPTPSFSSHCLAKQRFSPPGPAAERGGLLVA